MFPRIRHVPGQESTEVRRGLAPIIHTGLEACAEPMAGIEAPQDDGWEDANIIAARCARQRLPEP